MDLMMSPSYHLISPLARSRSELRGAQSMRRSQSYSYGSSSFTRPQYGYGGGYMSRSLSRSGSTLFGRSLESSILTRTPPLHSVGLQRSTPHYTDKYPYVRYSYGSTDTSLGLLSQSESLSGTNYGGVRDLGTKRWLEGRLNTYNTALFTTPDYNARVERPLAPVRNYIRYMPMEDAMDKYRKRCMTVGTLSKYWLSPTTWQSRREKEMNLSSATARGNYSYASRYSRYPSSYRTFASRLSTY
ncbi:hypothetical protein Tcan_08756 [Toxocara canis]|uniref:Uncharacterized protein n=2 Tax=Toxocara canis TaxID=6265 RepID=A0A0B2V5Q7_TOXCA|nr:hypothetical protein Tcan_08756 [Toxocara canis]VDM50892.1 unnamed protein product [Toxocara canis]